MPSVVIHEKPIALSELEIGPNTCAWITDEHELILASGDDYEQVLSVGKAACLKHGFELHETVLEHPESRSRELLQSPIDVNE